MFGYAALLGDIRGSRRSDTRSQDQDRLKQVLDDTSQSLVAIQPLAATVGDEFQGLFSSLGAALEATLLIRLRLIEFVDVRFGVGWGPLTLHQKDLAPFGQDGPAWWFARSAIERASALEDKTKSPRSTRTVFACSGSILHSSSEEEPGPDIPMPGLPPPVDLSLSLEPAINAYLIGRDALIDRLDRKDAELAENLFLGRSLSQTAAAWHVTVSAVSQRIVRRSLYALVTGQQQMAEALQ
ncbi:MAG: SatD family protein [Isosphaeraceae bacterium]